MSEARIQRSPVARVEETVARLRTRQLTSAKNGKVRDSAKYAGRVRRLRRWLAG